MKNHQKPYDPMKTDQIPTFGLRENQCKYQWGVGIFWGDLGFLDAGFLENGAEQKKSIRPLFSNLLVRQTHQISAKTVNNEGVKTTGDFCDPEFSEKSPTSR